MMFPLVVKTGPEVAAPASPIYYVLAKDGLYLVKHSTLFTTSTRVAGLPWLAEHGEGFTLHMPRIPAAVILQAWSFFRGVYHRYGSEAILFLYFDRVSEFMLVAPEQEVSPLTCFYQPIATPDGWVRVGTIHSHGQISAVHSLVDEEDEQFDDGLHLTLGNILEEPSIDCELVVGHTRFELNPGTVVEGLGTAIAASLPLPGYPADWLQRVSGIRMEAR